MSGTYDVGKPKATAEQSVGYSGKVVYVFSSKE